jgi:adenylate kinase family enzyme
MSADNPIETIGLRAIIITGPSSCGKGEVAKALSARLGISTGRWLSMGAILREVCDGVNDPANVTVLRDRHGISDTASIFSTPDISDSLRAKIGRNRPGLEKMFAARSGRRIRSDWEATTALDWLEYCTAHGLLVPNRWTQELIAARIANASAAGTGPIIFDGYPRTIAAAEHLLDVLARDNITVWKVLHLSISKQEMLHRAGLRQRADDDASALLKRYEFYVDSVLPSIDYMKDRLGTELVALIDAHQPSFDTAEGVRTLNLSRSIDNVVRATLQALSIPA